MKQPAKPKKINIVSVQLTPTGKDSLDDVCDKRGMTIKTLLGRLITWFVALDRTEQSMVLNQVEMEDAHDLATLLMKQRPIGNGAPPESDEARGRRAARR